MFRLTQRTATLKLAEAHGNWEEIMTTLRVLREKRCPGRMIAVAATLLAVSTPAVAQQVASGATQSLYRTPLFADQQPAIKVEAQPGPTESQLYRWIAPSAEEQLAADPTAVPAGSGAVFVPAMTNGADEPETLVFQAEKRVASGPNGKRIILAPGSYVLRIGSSPLNQMMSVPVEVTAGNTKLVPVTWGGIIVEVVDKNNVPHRGTYELIRVADRQPYTVGFGADTLLGEKLKTILAMPGLYRIVRPGANYRTRTDFSTVVIPEASMVYFKLVQDPDDGSLLGAGVVPPNEMGIVQPGSAWTRTMTVGIGLPITGSSNVVGTANQTTIGADFTFDTYMIYDRGKNYAGIIFEVEEGFVSIDPEVSPKLPLQKTVDRLRFDTIYTRLLSARIGPYVRFGVLTNLFESNVLVTEDTTVVKHLLDGTTTTEDIAANEDFLVGNAFAPVSIREGVGINVRLLRGRIASLDWRGGLGFRQNRFNGAFVLDDSATGFQEYSQQESFNETGVETTLVGTVRLSRLLLNTNLDLFGDFDELEDPTVDWRNTVSWRLTGGLSLDYRVDVLQQPQVTEDTQLRQTLQFRYSWGY